MKAILPSLELVDLPTPEPANGKVRLRIVASGVNRADILQAAGHYPPPPGITDVLGLEAVGIREDTGELVGALLAGGGYAEWAVVPETHLLPIPAGWNATDTAAIIEAACTVHSNLGMRAGLHAGQTVLIHGGAGGIGSFAIQYAKALGATVAVTAGSQENLDYCASLGADILINYKEQNFEEHVKADVILDIMGAKYLERNIRALADSGHLVIIGLQGGVKAEFNIARLLNKRGQISATALRSRTNEDKARIVADTIAVVWPMLEAGKIKPQVHSVLPLGEARTALDLLKSGIQGKIVLSQGSEDTH
ncbi:MAG: NAD(P)H-quinone oxidoreductase [Corynebacterium sp.]|nr:NAD(P)H-quinone oxidoreductase [Corynebacterium sp.]